MRLLGIFLTACVILAVMKVAIVALFVLFLISLVWGIYLHPREVLGFFAFCTLLGLAGAHPIICLLIIGAALTAGQFAR